MIVRVAVSYRLRVEVISIIISISRSESESESESQVACASVAGRSTCICVCWDNKKVERHESDLALSLDSPAAAKRERSTEKISCGPQSKQPSLIV